MPLPDNFRLRDCGPDDAEALSLVAAASFLEAFAGTLAGSDILLHCRNQHSVAKYAGWLAGTDAHLVLAEVDGAPVGYAMLYPPDLPTQLQPGDLELKRIYTLHRFQGCGTGRALMQWAITRAHTLAAPRLLLGVNAENDLALSFYRRHGFQECGTRTFQVGTALHHDLILSRPL